LFHLHMVQRQSQCKPPECAAGNCFRAYGRGGCAGRARRLCRSSIPGRSGTT
jgi:hypothetical protein